MRSPELGAQGFSPGDFFTVAVALVAAGLGECFKGAGGCAAVHMEGVEAVVEVVVEVGAGVGAESEARDDRRGVGALAGKCVCPAGAALTKGSLLPFARSAACFAPRARLAERGRLSATHPLWNARLASGAFAWLSGTWGFPSAHKRWPAAPMPTPAPPRSASKRTWSSVPAQWLQRRSARGSRPGGRRRRRRSTRG